MFKNKSFIALLLLTLLGGILRFAFLGQAPISPNWDEISHGYNSYSILTTGRDEWGISFPLIFRAFGDFKLPVYIYLTTIPIAIFGLSTFAIRFISALAGTLAIPGIYLLTKTLFPDKEIKFKKVTLPLSLISSFILAFMPWHFFISRPALEANLALTFIIFAAYFLLKGLENSKNFIPAALLFGLSLHTYNTARVFVPTLLLAFVLIYWKKIKLNKSAIFSCILIGLFALVVAYQLFSGSGTARYSKLNIITESTAYTLGQKRVESQLPPLIAKLVFNRPLYFVQTVVGNYFNYFSPTFFNQSWGAQSQFAIPGVNIVGLPVLILFLLGLLYFIRRPGEKSLQFIFAWLLLAPFAASLTVDPPQALRPNPMIPAIVLFAGLGAVLLMEKLSDILKTIVSLIIVLSILLNFSLYLNNYFVLYPKTYSESWQYGYQELYQYLSNQKDYHKFFVTKRYGEPHIFYAFYNKLNPTVLQDTSRSKRFYQSEWYWTDKIDNYYFVNEFDIPITKIESLTLESGEVVPTKDSLLVTTSGHVPVNANVLKTINFLDGSTAFIIAQMP